MMYRIWCTVSGGVTGHREAWLKVNGKVYETESYEKAQEKASDLMYEMNKRGYVATFTYTVEEV